MDKLIISYEVSIVNIFLNKLPFSHYKSETINKKKINFFYTFFTFSHI